MRIFAVSDIHVDFAENMAWIQALSAQAFCQDALLLAGDVSHDLSKMADALARLREKFAHVFYVPGNHDLWIVDARWGDSLEKFAEIRALCTRLGVLTEPVTIGALGSQVHVLPLLSWYVKPEEGDDSLYVVKQGEDPNLEAWADHHFIRWPKDLLSPAKHFLALNEPHLTHLAKLGQGVPTISFSHFVPRTELMFSDPQEDEAWGGKIPDRNRSFNFSRVAGTRQLDAQIRRANAIIHVYGHQHRNRHRKLEGLLYISHCLGYHQERTAGMIRYLEGNQPKQIWPEEPGA